MSARGFESLSEILKDFTEVSGNPEVVLVNSVDGVGYTTTRETIAQLLALGRNPALLNYIGLAVRPGVQHFSTYLEHMFYDPLDVPVNRLFQFRVVEWAGVTAAVASIPTEHRAYAIEAAKMSSLRISDTSIFQLIDKTYTKFPLQGINCFSLESEGGKWFGGARSSEEAMRMESLACEILVNMTKERFAQLSKG
jgi:hypothetical protein